jgi:hypothetical protein
MIIAKIFAAWGDSSFSDSFLSKAGPEPGEIPL